MADAKEICCFFALLVYSSRGCDRIELQAEQQLMEKGTEMHCFDICISFGVEDGSETKTFYGVEGSSISDAFAKLSAAVRLDRAINGLYTGGTIALVDYEQVI